MSSALPGHLSDIDTVANGYCVVNGYISHNHYNVVIGYRVARRYNEAMYDARVTGPELAQWRTDHGLTQQQLADRLGLNRVTIADWERGAANTKILKSRVIDLALRELERELAEK